MILVGNSFWKMSKAGSMQGNAASYEPEINQKDGEGDGGHKEKDKSLKELIKEKLKEKLEEILEETLVEKAEKDEEDKSLKELIEEKLKKKLEEMLEEREEKDEKDKRLEEVIEEKLEEKEEKDKKDKHLEEVIEEKLEEKLEEKEEKDKKDKSLEDAIEEKLEENLSVDVDVKRRGPILWISTGRYTNRMLAFKSSFLQRRGRGLVLCRPTWVPAAAAAVLSFIKIDFEKQIHFFLFIAFFQVAFASALDASSAVALTMAHRDYLTSNL